MLNKIFVFWIALCALISAEAHSPSFESCDLERATQALSHSGTLSRAGNFIYVDIDDQFVFHLGNLVSGEGFQPPPYFSGKTQAGAHISVCYANEWESCGAPLFEECGEVIAFTPLHYHVVKPPNWGEIEELLLLEVDAPTLDTIRAKYGLTEKVFPYHITIAVKYAQSASKLEIAE